MRRSLVELATAIALSAGELLANRFTRPVAATPKGRADIVTDADRDAESLIVGAIRSACPTHAVIAEEAGGGRGEAPFWWYVDPLDGTKNFARRHPVFAVSLAVADADGVVAGVVLDPLRGELFAAERGQGAFCNGQRVAVSSVDRLERSLVSTGFPSPERHRDAALSGWLAVTMETAGWRRSGSSALDLAYVAAGRIDAFWDVGLGPWDTAAGALLVAEAGGEVTTLSGGVYSPSGPDLVAGNGQLRAALVQRLGHEQWRR